MPPEPPFGGSLWHLLLSEGPRLPSSSSSPPSHDLPGCHQTTEIVLTKNPAERSECMHMGK